MLGIEWYEVLLLLKQLGIAIAGAGALWGLVFSRKDYSCGKKECIIWDWIAQKLSLLIFGGVALSFVAFLFLHSNIAFAHEGIVIFANIEEIVRASAITFPAWILLSVMCAGALLVERSSSRLFGKIMTPFYILVFSFAFVLSSLSAWTGALSYEQLFFAGHGFHSIFTLGTVLVLDFLFLLSKKSDILKQHLYPEFPLISKVVWIGLAFDFVSSLLILDQFVITEKFLFMQTVIGILIINGTLLSGPLTSKMLSSIQDTKTKLSGNIQRIANFAGTVSVSSWLTITIVDFFENITLGYSELLFGYLTLILILFIGHEIVEWNEKQKEAPVFIH